MESENSNAKEHDPKIADTNPTQSSQTIPQFPPPGGVPPVQAPPAPHSYQITCKTEKDWRDKLKFWAELVGILFLLLYTCETHRTNNLTQCAMNMSQQQFAESQRVSKQQFSDAQKASTRQFDLDQRPWIGIVFTIQDFEKGKRPKYTVQFQNTGRRPAKVSIAEANSRTYKVFPKHPAYPREPGNISSADVIVPNATLTHTDTIDFPSDAELTELTKFPRQETLYIYASVDYEDVVTHASHWTHGCWQYYPGYGGPFGSWVNCAVYHEVDEERP